MMEHIEFVFSVKFSISQLLRWSRILELFLWSSCENTTVVYICFFEDHHERDKLIESQQKLGHPVFRVWELSEQPIYMHVQHFGINWHQWAGNILVWIIATKIVSSSF